MKKLIILFISFISTQVWSLHITPSINKSVTLAELGKILFFDPRLSGSNLISCATCHNPDLGWSDGLAIGFGHNGARLTRHSPHLYDISSSKKLFWDGRASSLEEQALDPIQSPIEMNQDLDELNKELSSIKGYQEMFAQHFPATNIQTENIAKALAEFQRTIKHGYTPFERLMDGDRENIHPDVLEGYQLFSSAKTNCIDCHSGPNFSDDQFHDIGMEDSDLGRGVLFPEIPKLQHTFKTPILWNVTKNPPYFHDGSAPTLKDVIEHYNDGGDAQRVSKDHRIRPLNLTDREKQLLIIFLESLTEEKTPEFIRPVLPE